MGAHSNFGGSKIGVIELCAGYVNAVKDYPNVSTAAAEKGTAYHHCAEYCQRLGFDAADVLGVTFNGFVCDADMVESVQVYLNYIRSLRLKHSDAKGWVEGKVVLSSIAPDVFGYADDTVLSRLDRTLYISDLKGGFVLVDVEGMQTPFYAVGTLDTFNLWYAVDKVVCTIIQPRTEHSEGTIRTRTYTIEEMMVWRDRIAETVRKARSKDALRVAGTHCIYCPAAGSCRKRLERTVYMSSLIGSMADLTNDELSAILEEIPAINKTLETLKDYATNIARGGSTIKNFKLVKPILRAKCVNEQELINKILATKKVPENELYNPGKLKGKTVLGTLLKSKKIDDIKLNDYFETPVGAAELVPLSNPRAAISNDVRGVFSPIED